MESPSNAGSNKADIESRLRQTAETMSDRLSSIQDEVSSTGISIRNWMVRNPVKSVGGMLAAGLAVGLVFGGSRSSRRQSQLIDTYVDALRQEAETAIDEGEEPGPALEKALRDRVPLVVFRENNQRGRGRSLGRYLIQESAEILFSTGVSLLAREAIEALLSSLDVEEIIEEELAE